MTFTPFNIELIKALVEAGADVNANMGGFSPFHIALNAYPPMIELLKLFIKAGAHIDAWTQANTLVQEAQRQIAVEKQSGVKLQPQEVKIINIEERDPLDEFPGAKNAINKFQQAYIILGLEQGADSSAIKKAYRILALKWHPDKWASASVADQEHAKRVFQVIHDAYEYLIK
jgi:hypothetical protein